jgi:hypothetical protein
MLGRPITIEVRGEAHPRLAAGCAACGANEETTPTRFLGKADVASLLHLFPFALVAVFGYSLINTIAYIFVAGTALLGAAVWIVLFLRQRRKWRENALDVPLCKRCAAEERAHRNAGRTWATFESCSWIVLLSFMAFGTINTLVFGAVVFMVIAIAMLLWLATRKPTRLSVEIRSDAVRIRFPNAEIAQRFAAENGT